VRSATGRALKSGDDAALHRGQLGCEAAHRRSNLIVPAFWIKPCLGNFTRQRRKPSARLNTASPGPIRELKDRLSSRPPRAGYMRENIVGTQGAVLQLAVATRVPQFENDAPKLSANWKKLAIGLVSLKGTKYSPNCCSEGQSLNCQHPVGLREFGSQCMRRWSHCMSYNDSSKPSDDAGQAIRRLPTGLYELSPSLQRPQPTLRRHKPPRFGRALDEALFGPIFLNESGPGGKVVRSLLFASVMVPIGIASVVMLSPETVALITKPTVETKNTAPVPTVEASSGGVDRASIEQLSRGVVSDSAASTEMAKPASTVRAEWLVDNLAKAGQDLRSRKQASSWFPATTSPDDTDRGREEVTRSVGKRASNFGDPTSSELRSSPISRTRTEKHRFDPHHTARRGTFKSPPHRSGYESYWDRFFQPWEF